MTAKEIIMQTIEKDERFSEIRLNTKTNKIEIGDNKIIQCGYDEILDKCKLEYPDTKFTKQTIKDVVDLFAREHKYEPEDNEPENKHNNSCPWYDKYKVDDKGKILHTIYNILVLFVNDPRFKGKFSCDTSVVNHSTYELFNNRHMSILMICCF